MDKITIEESKMQFGEYNPDDFYYLEKSDQYRKHVMSSGIKCCEFVLLRKNTLIFVEAKESCPNYYEANSTDEKKKKYEAYVYDIVQKMRDSLMLYANILLERYEQNDIADNLLEKNLSEKKLILILVVKNAEKKWLEPFADVFRKRLHDEMKIWKIQSFLVINEAKAREKRLVM